MKTKLNSRQVGRLRVVIAAWLHGTGVGFRGIGQVLRLPPDAARTLVARARRRGLAD